ncbi:MULTISPECIES: LysR family transcriptional regulator [Shewanella]|uniref:LysR family transcriptional regulator n=1 Tax=Shewanella algae TaxID=38313 RepID=A0A7T8IRI1_9GAMM|nr:MULTISPECIES: LysR family transcriptional regulator [Shewanella]MBO2630641.1 LysR family transcriptional regulator [Shewanella algae]MBO2702652.1 LysR family transcriptional regulator [Shewanella algae]MCE9780880.1 LysR family transcriptional regulator [Shewanella algae]MCE9783567.1 LysR family transcriptional regulator [Shewanella algae]MCE9826788.1 LysR family transcriptional regulator [Shewanella algae]
MNRQMVKAMLVFATTVEKGTMNAAARQLCMSTSAVSQQIFKLEQQLGLGLLNRSTRALTPTEAGKLFYQSCVQMIALADETELQLSRLKDGPAGELRIAAPVGFGGGLLSEPLRRLLEAHPGIQLSLQLQDETVDLVGSGIDLAICIGPLADSALVAHHLADWQMLLCVAPDFLRRRGNSMPMHPGELQNWERLCHKGSMVQDSMLSHTVSGEQLSLAPGRLAVNNMQSLIRFTLDGLGYAALPEPEVRQFLQQGTLLPLLPDWQLPQYSVYALTAGREAQAPKIREAIATLSACFAEDGPLVAA